MFLSLSAIRIFNGYTEEEAGKLCEVSEEQMRELERDPINMAASMVLKLRGVYGIPIDYVI